VSDESKQSPPLPRLFGGYELLEEVGSGGMGVIYRARQPGLDRFCAIKMLKSGSGDKGWTGEQLRAEARAAASLDHPNIVGIYEVGEVGQQLYFSMELVDGQDLSRFVRGRLLSPKVVATYVRKIAEAIQYAHERGVLHCDLKPANILIDQRDEPRITDFGLSRRTGPGAIQKNVEYGAGSPNFMAPEQASERCGAITGATDVFGIGATLYYLLTDRPPFRGETFTATLQAVINSDPVPPRTLRPGIPVDLETICLKCLEKRPVRRYRNPGEVVQELDRFLQDMPIKARHITGIERGWRLARRRPLLSSLVVATALLLGTVALVSSLATVHINRALDLARMEERRAKRSEFAIRRNLYTSDIALAFQALSDGNSDRVRELLERQRPEPGAIDFRGWEWSFLWSLSRPDDLGVVIGNGAAIHSIHLLRGGKELITSDNNFHVQRWDATTWKSLLDIRPHAASSVYTFLDPRERWLALTDRAPQATNNRVVLIDPLTGTNLIQFDGVGFPIPRASSPDGQELWVVAERAATAYSTQTGAPLRSVPFDGDNSQRAFDASADGKWIAWGMDQGRIAVGDATTGKTLRTIRGHKDNPPFPPLVQAVAISPDSRLLASGATDGTIRLWNLPQLESVGALPGHPDFVTTVAFSSDGQHLVTSGRDSFLRIWKLPEGRLESTLRHHSGLIITAAFLPGDREILTAGEDGNVRRWPLKAPSRAMVFTNLPASYGIAEFTADGRHYVWSRTTSNDGNIGVNTLFNPRPLISYSSETNVLVRAVVVPDTGPSWTATYRFGGKIQLDSSNGGESAEYQITPWITMPRGGNSATLFSASGQRLLVADLYNGLQVFTVPGLKRIRHLQGRRFDGAALSPDGKWFAGVQLSGPSVIGEVNSDRTYPVDTGNMQIQNVVFSPSGGWVAFENMSGIIHLFKTFSGQHQFTLHAPTSGLTSVAFSPDEKRLVAGSIEGTLFFWDLTTGSELGAYNPHHGIVGGLRFLEDGSLVLLGTDAHCQWTVPTLAQLDAEKRTR
jgi:eukaryotic-like serine/threonine-protein kinase